MRAPEVLLTPGPHFPNAQLWPISLVGAKADGLQALPPQWTTPYVVLTVAAHAWWRSGRHPLDEVFSEWPVYSDLAQYLDSSQMQAWPEVMVRSSAVSETLRDRGLHLTFSCARNATDVLRAASSIWTDLQATSTDIWLAIIVQSKVASKLLGHLSNERRISRYPSRWRIEQGGPGVPLQGGVLNVVRRDIGEVAKAGRLSCARTRDLRSRLRAVAALNESATARFHYEWAWDGTWLWVVQADQEESSSGEPPGADWPRGVPNPKDHGPMRVLVGVDQCIGAWRKVECIRTFRQCGLPHPVIWVLEDPGVLEELGEGCVPAQLKKDLQALVDTPIIVRTDVSDDVAAGMSVLLPRSSLMEEADQAAAFLLATLRGLKNRGVPPAKVCFLMHRCIPARGCALALAWPDKRGVRLDASWGSPDGLLYFPHDSFEVDVETNRVVNERIRCKCDYLDIGPHGEWVEKHAGADWDWKRSLAINDLIAVASASFAIAKHVGKPVSVMFFVNVPPWTGHPAILPWYYTADLPDWQVEPAKALRHVLITSEEDLEALWRRGTTGIGIKLRPAPEALRDESFLKRVAEFAVESNSAVELEGSLLSHTYYTLRRCGARVQSADPFFAPGKASQFGKLVRDDIPRKIESGGEIAKTLVAGARDFIVLLKAKAVEEALELAAESDPRLSIEELADLFEVMTSLAEAYGCSWPDVREIADRKRGERGGFSKGIVLVETYPLPLIPTPGRLPLFPTSALERGPAVATPGASRQSGQEASWGVWSRMQVPRCEDGTLVIPLVPVPGLWGRGRHVVPLHLHGEEHEAVVEYGPKEVGVRFCGKPKPSFRVLSIFGDQSPNA